MWPWREKPYRRMNAMAQADRYRASGRARKAIDAYRQILAHDGDDPTAIRKLAPLLAETRQDSEALARFNEAAAKYSTEGFNDKAIAVYAQAVSFYPHEPELWESIARLQVSRQKSGDAVKTLRRARQYFRKPNDVTTALRLLGQALQLDPRDADTRLDIAGTLAKDGQRSEAIAVLDVLVNDVRGRDRARARWTMFRIDPSWRRLADWIRARFGRGA
jgi:tetratricopeptide (TPR) repeat protein